MSDPIRSIAAIEPRVSRSHVSWGVEIGRVRVAVTRTRETQATDALGDPAPRSRWPFAGGAIAGVGAVALLVVGASAAPRMAEPARYMVSLPIPSALPQRVAKPATRSPARRAHGRRADAPIAGADFDAADEPYVARAMATGGFQEWEDAFGQRRFLTAGPAHAENGRSCRAMALLVRLAEGGSRVRSAERCVAGPVSDPPAPEPEPSEG